MPQTIPLLTFMLIHMWYEKSNPPPRPSFLLLVLRHGNLYSQNNMFKTKCTKLSHIAKLGLANFDQTFSCNRCDFLAMPL